MYSDYFAPLDSSFLVDNKTLKNWPRFSFESRSNVYEAHKILRYFMYLPIIQFSLLFYAFASLLKGNIASLLKRILMMFRFIPVFPKLFEPRHTKVKSEISRHTKEFAFIFWPSNIALLVLDQQNLQLNLN
jgi:hypothetical protein